MVCQSMYTEKGAAIRGIRSGWQSITGARGARRASGGGGEFRTGGIEAQLGEQRGGGRERGWRTRKVRSRKKEGRRRRIVERTRQDKSKGRGFESSPLALNLFTESTEYELL